MNDAHRAALRDRIIAGELVTVADVAAVNELEAAALLAELHDGIDAARAEHERSEQRAAAIVERLASFEAEADRVTDRMAAAAPLLDATIAELLAAASDLDDVVRTHLDGLRRLGWSVSEPGDVIAATGGRVIIDRDQLPKLKLHVTAGPGLVTIGGVPDPAPYVRWARQLQAERDAITAGE